MTFNSEEFTEKYKSQKRISTIWFREHFFKKTYMRISEINTNNENVNLRPTKGAHSVTLMDEYILILMATFHQNIKSIFLWSNGTCVQQKLSIS